MEIIPAKGKIVIHPEKTDLGAFEQVDSRVSERGVITHIGEGVDFWQIGDKVIYKAWGMDSFEEDGVKYFVADLDRKNLLCKILHAITGETPTTP